MPFTYTCRHCGAAYQRHSKAQPGVACSQSCAQLSKPRAVGLPLAERLWPRVDKSGECWVWTGAMTRGYGKLGYHGKDLYAHRASYVLAYGPIPPGMAVCHRCDNPPCVRPDHLFLGTQLDNIADMTRKGRAAAGYRSGPRRHPERMRRGESQPAARLTEADVREMRSRAAAGESNASLGRAFGVVRSAVWNIVHGKSWVHVA